MTLRVFVADDSLTIQKIVSLAFSAEDAVVEAVSNGDAALEALRRFKPDVVLADVFMPGCSGYEVCARVKEDPELRNVPVILLVGTFEPFDESEASRVHSDACLTKPFDTTELIRTVHRLAGDQETAPKATAARRMASPQALESFVGGKRILDIFDPETPSAGDSQMPLNPEFISEETLDAIVERVVRRMSPEIIREVAWEVIPELSESIIREKVEK